jgi:hypothetical protein
MNDTSLKSPRRRASPTGHIHTRAARLAVGDIQAHLATWQLAAASLRAAEMFGHRAPADARTKATQIISELINDRIALDARLTDLGPDVASHSLLRDIRRALDRLHADLEDLVDR